MIYIQYNIISFMKNIYILEFQGKKGRVKKLENFKEILQIYFIFDTFF